MLVLFGIKLRRFKLKIKDIINMKYIIINKWQLKDCKPTYYLKEVVESLEIANAKLRAYQIIESDKNDSYFIVPFNEEALLLTEEVA